MEHLGHVGPSTQRIITLCKYRIGEGAFRMFTVIVKIIESVHVETSREYGPAEGLRISLQLR